MGLTKQYLRYLADGTFNITASANCNIAFVTFKGQQGRFVAVGTCEDVTLWDLRLSEKALVLPGEKFEVTRLAASNNTRRLAVGYADGTIKIFDLNNAECICTFSGHRSAITCLSFSMAGNMLASGSKDTEVIVWDVVAECGQHRLSGHKGAVTQVCFMQEVDVLISSSKDSYVKFWDLDTGHCFKTLIAHKAEVWDLALLSQDKYLVTGSSDSELSVWHLLPTENESNKETRPTGETFTTGEEQVENFGAVACRKVGLILRQGRGRLQALVPDASSQFLACHAGDNSIEIFKFNTNEEALAKLRKRRKKEKKKAAEMPDAEDPNANSETSITLSDEVRRLTTTKCSEKIKSCDLITGNGGEIRIATVLRNNSIEMHSVVVGKSAGTDESHCLRILDKLGHRSDVRAVTFSSDSLAVATGSAESVKIWNRASQSCLRAIETGYVLSLCFVPGDRHLLIGLKDGKLLVADISTAEILEEIPAHEQEIWSVVLTSDQRGCVTGSGDKTIKFWDFELVVSEGGESKAKVLSLLHTRSLQLDEGVLNVCISPNGRHIAAALLDSTVKIFFFDTLKFFVSLYGHKLPVLCMDISYDSTIICTGSADRNVKIWGLDFGDCHKSLFAHDDTVMGLKFVPKTHYFFTCGKDGTVKQWDADCYERILTLQGHQGSAHSLAVSDSFVVSCGSDRVVRLWSRSAEPLVLEDEREEERTQQDEAALVTGTDTVVPGQSTHKLPSRKTVGAEKAAEVLMEGVELAETYRTDLEEHQNSEGPKPPIPPLMVALGSDNPDDFLLDTLKRIRASDLEEALLLLPFSIVCQLLSAMPHLLRREWGCEVVLRTLSFLMKVHHEPVIGTRALLPVIKQLQHLSLSAVEEARDRVGTNLHGLQVRQRKLEAEESTQVFREASQRRKEKDKRRRRKERAIQRAILTL